MSFDYGNKKDDGQYQTHPTNLNGEYVAPIRNSYIHAECGSKTFCGDAIAETYARNPTFYTRTFCSHCGDYFPINNFKWAVDGVILGEIGGVSGKDMKQNWNTYRK